MAYDNLQTAQTTARHRSTVAVLSTEEEETLLFSEANAATRASNGKEKRFAFN